MTYAAKKYFMETALISEIWRSAKRSLGRGRTNHSAYSSLTTSRFPTSLFLSEIDIANSLAERLRLMPLERKRKPSENESAISKLRKARSTPSNTPTREPSPVKQAQGAKASKQSQKQRKEPRKAQPRSAPAVLDEGDGLNGLNDEADDAEENGNSFAALSSLDAQGQRTYERLPDGRLRVELAKGADCVVAGRCSLWVKHGTVHNQGAILRASTDLYRIAAPIALSLPSIRAIHGDAEFELAEIRESGLSALDASLNLFKPPVGLIGTDPKQKYYVLGLDFAPAPGLDRSPRILNINEGYFKDVTELKHPASQCFMFHCSRPLEAATLVRCLLNRLVTTEKQNEGSILLDLNSRMPVSSPPGFVSVSRLAAPIFGSSFDRHYQKGVQTVRQHFVGPITADLPPNSWYGSCVIDLARMVSGLRRQHPDTPILVNLDSMVTLDPALLEDLWRELSPTSVLSLDSSKVTTTTDRLSALAKRTGLPLRSLPSINEIAHLSQSHQLNLHSYFRGFQNELGQPIAHTPEIPELTFRYGGPDAELVAITTIDIHMPQINVHKTVKDLLAAILLVDLSRMTLLIDQVRKCATSRLPVLPALTNLELGASLADCVGLCHIDLIDIADGTISLKTPVHQRKIRAALDEGKGLLLIVQPPTREGTFMPQQR